MSWKTITLFESLYSNIPNQWTDFFMREDIRKHIASISTALEVDVRDGAQLCPRNIDDVFMVFRMVSPANIKCVILGLDPYHTPVDAATGIAFSLPRDHTHINPSVSNILKVCRQCGFSRAENNGCLNNWVEQGVFLLNTALTSKAKRAREYISIWMPFTQQLIQYISKIRTNLVFMLWGRESINYQYHIINKHKHCILTASHPSGLSAYTKMVDGTSSFMTSKCFSKANEYLKMHNIPEIGWT